MSPLPVKLKDWLVRIHLPGKEMQVHQVSIPEAYGPLEALERVKRDLKAKGFDWKQVWRIAVEKSLR